MQSIHKLTAGDGYAYLTRQVAALDDTDRGHTGLGEYYTEQGEFPGAWLGCPPPPPRATPSDTASTAEATDASTGP